MVLMVVPPTEKEASPAESERGRFGVALWTLRHLKLKGKARAGSEAFVVTL